MPRLLCPHALPLLQATFRVPVIGVLGPGVDATLAEPNCERVGIIGDLRQRGRSAVSVRLRHEHVAAGGRRAELMALSPQATLDRGFAVVRRSVSGQVISRADQLTERDTITVRVASGSFTADVAHIEHDDPSPTTSEDTR